MVFCRITHLGYGFGIIGVLLYLTNTEKFLKITYL